jgi:hypothetical protein
MKAASERSLLEIEAILVNRVGDEGGKWIGAIGNDRDNPTKSLFSLYLDMASALNKFVASLTPPPVINPVEYDGLEYRWKMLVFRPACKFPPCQCPFLGTNF